MTRWILSILLGVLLGALLGTWSVRAPTVPPTVAEKIPPSSTAPTSISRPHADPSSQTTNQLLAALRQRVPDAQLRVQAWHDGRLTAAMARALGLSTDEEAILNSAVSVLADDMARASHERLTVEAGSDSVSLIVPAFSQADEVRSKLYARFREAIGEERTRLLLTATGARSQLDRACRFFGEYEQRFEITIPESSGPLLFSEYARRYDDVVDERGHSLGHRFVSHKVPLRQQAPVSARELERFAGVRWRQVLPESVVARVQ